MMLVDPEGELFLEIIAFISIIVVKFILGNISENARNNADPETGRFNLRFWEWTSFTIGTPNTWGQDPFNPPPGSLPSTSQNEYSLSEAQNNLMTTSNSENNMPCPSPIVPEKCEALGYLPFGEGYENTDFGSASNIPKVATSVAPSGGTPGGAGEDQEEDNEEEEEDTNCDQVLVCPEGQVFNEATCSCKVECLTTTGYLLASALGDNVVQGLNTVLNTDNFRNELGAIIATINCNTGKIYKDALVNVLSTIPQTRDYIKADGTVGQSTYYPIEFKNCDGNLPQNEDYDPEKPCADCDRGNPLQNMNDLQNTPSGIANPEHRHGGDYGWTRDRRDSISTNSGDNYFKFHSGYDIEAPVGTAIYAAHAGTVDALIDSHPNDVSQWTDAEGNFDYVGYKDWREVQTPPLATNAGGNKIKIGWTENGSYFSHNYEHVQQGTILISAGDVVTKGQLIGYTGITGNAQTQANGGPHLHFSKYDATGAIDPSDDILANYNDDGHDDDPCDDN